MKKLLDLLTNEQKKIIDKNSNDVITDLILEDFLVKSNSQVMDQVNKTVNENPEDKIFDNIKKILDSDNYDNTNQNCQTDCNNQIEKTENLKNKIFSIVYNLLINKTDITDYDELCLSYNKNNPIQSIEIDNYLEQNVDDKKEKQILLKLIKILF